MANFLRKWWVRRQLRKFKYCPKHIEPDCGVYYSGRYRRAYGCQGCARERDEKERRELVARTARNHAVQARKLALVAEAKTWLDQST